MNGFERRREKKKTSILEAALSLYLKYGIKKVSVAEIAEEANVSQVTIYNYFESKENLTYEVVVFYVDKVWEEYEEVLYSDMPFPDKIKQIIFDKRVVADEINEDFYMYFMKIYTSEDNYIEKFYREKALPNFKKLFDQGKEHGYVDRNISDEAIMFYIQMFADYMQRDDVAQSVLPLTEDLTKLFFYGVAGKSEK